MKLVRWSPFEEMSILRDQIDRIFEPLVPGASTNGDSRILTHTFPVEITEKPESYFVRVMAPGVSPENFQLKCSQKELLISAEIRPRDLEKDEAVIVHQFQYGNFSKQLNFVESIDESKVEARFENGILEINLPKLENSKRKMIEVKVKS